MSQERMRLVMPCPLLMRPYGGCGGGGEVGERAEAEGCSCAEVRGYPGYGRPCALQRQVPAVQGVRPCCASDSVHLQVWGIPVVYAQCNLCRRPAIPRYWCSSGALLICLSLCNDRRRGACQCKQLWISTVAALWQWSGGFWERKAVCSCFQARVGDELN